MDFISTIVDEVLRAIRKEGKNNYSDKTFPSVIYGVNDNGNTYTIIKDNQKYKVKNATNTTLSLGQSVWVKIPCGRLNDMHICGLR